MRHVVWFMVVVMLGVLRLSSATSAQPVTPCPDPQKCAHATIGSATGKPGDTVTVGVTFQQGHDDAQPGGIDEVAALAFTLRLGAPGTGLTLADCTLDSQGLPHAVKPDASIADFRVVVENASCANRPSCLCPAPGSGVTPDDHINLAIYGPFPVPTAGAMPVRRTLPVGPQQLLTIDLKLPAQLAAAVPLRILTAWQDSALAPLTAFLSAGDKLSVDQTCIPVAGKPPCDGPDRVSQVVTTDGIITVELVPTATSVPTAIATNTAPPATPTGAPTLTPTAGATATVTSTAPPTATATSSDTATPVATEAPTQVPTVVVTETPTIAPTEAATATPVVTPTTMPTPAGCAGDCNGSGTVTVDEIVTLVNIGLGTANVSTCLAGDTDGDHLISVAEIITGVNNSLNGCP